MNKITAAAVALAAVFYFFPAQAALLDDIMAQTPGTWVNYGNPWNQSTVRYSDAQLEELGIQGNAEGDCGFTTYSGSTAWPYGGSFHQFIYGCGHKGGGDGSVASFNFGTGQWERHSDATAFSRAQLGAGHVLNGGKGATGFVDLDGDDHQDGPSGCHTYSGGATIHPSQPSRLFLTGHVTWPAGSDGGGTCRGWSVDLTTGRYTHTFHGGDINASARINGTTKSCYFDDEPTIMVLVSKALWQIDPLSGVWSRIRSGLPSNGTGGFVCHQADHLLLLIGNSKNRVLAVEPTANVWKTLAFVRAPADTAQIAYSYVPSCQCVIASHPTRGTVWRVDVDFAAGTATYRPISDVGPRYPQHEDRRSGWWTDIHMMPSGDTICGHQHADSGLDCYRMDMTKWQPRPR